MCCRCRRCPYTAPALLLELAKQPRRHKRAGRNLGRSSRRPDPGPGAVYRVGIDLTNPQHHALPYLLRGQGANCTDSERPGCVQPSTFRRHMLCQTEAGRQPGSRHWAEIWRPRRNKRGRPGQPLQLLQRFLAATKCRDRILRTIREKVRADRRLLVLSLLGAWPARGRLRAQPVCSMPTGIKARVATSPAQARRPLFWRRRWRSLARAPGLRVAHFRHVGAPLPIHCRARLAGVGRGAPRRGRPRWACGLRELQRSSLHVAPGRLRLRGKKARGKVAFPRRHGTVICLI